VTVSPSAATAFDDFFGASATVPLVVTAPGVLVNDIGLDGAPLTAVLVSGPTNSNASLTLNADGSFTYHFGADLSSPVVDTFTYMANDGTGNSNVATVFITVSPFFSGTPTTDRIGTYRQGRWFLDANGNGQWDFGIDRIFNNFGGPTDIPVTGDWDGNGIFQFGTYRQGQWFLDNGNGAWDPELDTVIANFGTPTDKPVAGDVDGDNITEIGVYRPATGQWFFDLDNNGWTQCQADGGTDLCLTQFGSPGDIPVTGDWDGNGTTEVGVYRQGTWYLDANGNGAWDPELDTVIDNFGSLTDNPVTGDMDGDGISEVGVYRPATGQWFFDLDHSGSWSDCGPDLCLTQFGGPGDIPVTGRW
jgi:hypothetical protein